MNYFRIHGGEKGSLQLTMEQLKRFGNFDMEQIEQLSKIQNEAAFENNKESQFEMKIEIKSANVPNLACVH